VLVFAGECTDSSVEDIVFDNPLAIVLSSSEPEKITFEIKWHLMAGIIINPI